MKEKYEALFSPIKVGGVTLKNRVILTAMGGTGLFGYDGKFNEALNAAVRAKSLFPKSRMAQITVSEILAVMSNPKNKPRPIQPRHRIELSGDY